ncbi:hypothetical protein M9Y10_013883 [Tritrichomonas musculus]|uniref:KilA-N domain-containing protein n=1 Tax=Tritrichomonas musculus TaxID=1915356 RepID=A0ABR2KZZ7_9EUKA
MYQMQSIIKACGSKKQPTRWFNMVETDEIIKELRSMQNCTDQEFLENSSGGIPLVKKLYEDRPNLPNELKGTYVHKLLVNDIACWANRKYAIYIAQLLDTYFEKQRNQLQTKVNEQKPRMVPNGKQKSYKYMIWKEIINDKPEYIRLNLVRRNAKSFYEVSKIRNTNAC